MLKSTHDQLSKIWKPLTIWQPFYKGGKLQISKDGQQIACEYEGNLKFVNTSDTSSSSSFFDDDVPFEAVQCFAVHPNWKEVVIATVKFSISHWIIDGKQQQKTMKAHRMPILCMEYDLTGNLVATGSADRTVRVWDVVRGYCTHVFSEHSDLIKSVFFHQPKGKGGQLFLVSTSEDNSVALFDLVQQRKQAHFTSEHVSVPTKAVVMCEDRLLVSCGRDKVLNFFSLKTLYHLKVVPVVEELEAMTCLPDAVSRRLIEKSVRKEEFLQNSKHSAVHLLVTAGVKGVLRFFVVRMDGDDVASLQVSLFFQAPLSSLPQQSGISEEVSQLCGVTHLDYLTQSEEIFVSTNDFNLCHYSLDVLGRYIESHANIAVSSSLLASHSLISSSSLPRLSPSHLLVGHHGDVLDVISLPRSSENEDELAWQGLLVTNSPQLRLLSTSSSSAFRCEKMFEGHSDIILAVDVTPDGQYVVTSAKDKTVRVWSIALGECVALGEGHTDAIGSVCVSHFPATYQSRKAFIVSGASDKILKKWSLPTHSLSSTSPAVAQRLTSTQSIRAHDKDINCVTVAPNDSLVASASQDKTIRLWNPDDLSAIATLHGHKRGVWKVVFSPSDKGVLMSCSGDRTVKVWSLTDFTVLKTLEGNTASVLNLRLTHAGDQCITAAADGLLRLFTLRSQECISTMEEHDDRVWAIDSFHTSSDHYLVSGGSDSKLVLWKDVTKEEEVLAIQQREEKVQLEQQLYNYISKKNYLPALQLALQLKYSQRVLSILQTIIEDASSATSSSTPYDTDEQQAGDSLEFHEKGGHSQRIAEKFQRLFERQWSKCLDSYLLQLSDEHRTQLVVFLKDWNTNSRHCYLCQLIFNAFLRLFHASSLLQKSEWREVVAGFRAYTERHHARVSRLLQASYYINYVIASMQGFLPLETLNRITHVAPDEVTQTTQNLLKEVQDEEPEEEQEVSYAISKSVDKVEEETGVKRSFEVIDRSESKKKKSRKRVKVVKEEEGV